MAIAVIMPRQGQSVESCIITEWKKKVGDAVKEGDILFSYETDKSSFEEAAAVSGTLLAVFAEEGDDVPCLQTVCVIGESGEDFSHLIPSGAEAEMPAAPAEKPTAQQPQTPAPASAEMQPNAGDAGISPAQAGGKLKISPRARNLAERTGADVLRAVPTGPDGRVIERDIQAVLDRGETVSSAALKAYLEAGRSVCGTGSGGRVLLEDLREKTEDNGATVMENTDDFGSFEEEKLSNVRKVIAKSMHASLSEMAQLTLNASFDATQILQYRAQLKERAESMGIANITLNDMVLYAAAKTLLSHRALNAHFMGETIRYFKHVNLGVAVDTERGLLVPTLFGADRLSLNELARRSKTLISGAQKGGLDPDLLKGGTFTVTNLGALGIESFTPVINPPQTAILGVNTIVQRARESKEGGIEYFPAMGLSLTFDHRALDGAPAARFLQHLCRNLENFSLLLSL